MSTEIISTCVIAAFLGILLIGFLFGLSRGFNKSLTRLLLVVATLVIAFFIAPKLTETAMTVDLSNFNITINEKVATNLGDAIKLALEGIPQLQDIAGTDAYAAIINIVPQLVLNVVLFLVVFVALRLVSMLIYWIVSAICFNKKKTEGKNKHRLLGSVVGVVQNFLIFLVILVPVIGVINTISDVETIVLGRQETTEESSTLTSSDLSGETDASAEGSEGDTGETPNEEDNQVSPYQTVKDVIEAYSESWVAKFLHSLKLDNACLYVFDELSTVTVDENEYKLRAEAGYVTNIVLDLNDLMELGDLDFSNPQVVAALNQLIDSCYKSNLTAGLIDECIPLAATKWSTQDTDGNWGTFCGLSRPTFGAYDGVVDNLLAELSKNNTNVKTALTNAITFAGNLLSKVDNIISDDGKVNVDTIGELLNSLDDESMLEFTKELLDEDNINTIVDSVLPPVAEGDNTYNELLKETLNTVIGADYSNGTNTFSNEVAVVTSTLDALQKLTNPGDTAETQFSQEDANAVINALSESTVILGMLDETTDSTMRDQLNQQISNTDGAAEMLQEAINSLDNTAMKEKLEKIFSESLDTSE